MFKESAEHYYIRYIKVPALAAKKKYLKRFTSRHDFDIVKVSKNFDGDGCVANQHMFVNYIQRTKQEEQENLMEEQKLHIIGLTDHYTYEFFNFMYRYNELRRL